jgi:hypothetical protein
MTRMQMVPIIEDIQKTIKENCSNPKDYEGYVDNRLKQFPWFGADYYKCTTDQFIYCCNRALLSI